LIAAVINAKTKHFLLNFERLNCYNFTKTNFSFCLQKFINFANECKLKASLLTVLHLVVQKQQKTKKNVRGKIRYFRGQEVMTGQVRWFEHHTSMYVLLMLAARCDGLQVFSVLRAPWWSFLENSSCIHPSPTNSLRVQNGKDSFLYSSCDISRQIRLSFMVRHQSIIVQIKEIMPFTCLFF